MTLALHTVSRSARKGSDTQMGHWTLNVAGRVCDLHYELALDVERCNLTHDDHVFLKNALRATVTRYVDLYINMLDTNEIVADSEEDEDFLIPPITTVAGPLNLLSVSK